MASAVNNRRKQGMFGPDGRTVTIAIDHSSYFGPLRGLREPGPVDGALAKLQR
jgi:hypothetical protein